ncbi:MAG: 50S ribosomal protein L30 [Chloroflexi bacterium]|nr:50S ribosomal protein L30 [Chloroflexota bacterium]
MPASQPSLKITLVKSPIGYSERQKLTARALGLRKLHHSVIRPDNPQMRGMVFAIQHLVTVEEVMSEHQPRRERLDRSRGGSGSAPAASSSAGAATSIVSAPAGALPEGTIDETA